MTPRHLSDRQRARIRDYFTDHPTGGYKSACNHAGISPVTKAEARKLIEADPDLADHREKSLGIDEDSAWQRLVTIAKNTEHKDSLRANTFILAAVHGRSETTRLELTGTDGGPVVLAHEQRLTLAHVAALAAQLDNGSSTSTSGELPAPRPLLAASDDS